jgi:hypothetical protein
VRGAGTGQCSANDSPLKLSFQGTCGDDTAETDPACRTLQTCTSDSDCSGTRAGRCALVGNGPVRACQCNITNATCASPYTCDTTQNRCVYNDQCKTQSGNILVDPFAGAYSPLAVLPWVDGIERYGAGGTVENPELRANGNTPLAAAIREATAWYKANIANDPQRLCRPYDVRERRLPNKVYVVGINVTSTALGNMATAGGTAPARYATSQEEIHLHR